MKLRKGWEITTSHGDVIVITHNAMNNGTIRRAKRHGYKLKRVAVLS